MGFEISVHKWFWLHVVQVVDAAHALETPAQGVRRRVPHMSCVWFVVKDCKGEHGALGLHFETVFRDRQKFSLTIHYDRMKSDSSGTQVSR